MAASNRVGFTISTKNGPRRTDTIHLQFRVSEKKFCVFSKKQEEKKKEREKKDFGRTAELFLRKTVSAEKKRAKINPSFSGFGVLCVLCVPSTISTFREMKSLYE